MENRSREEEWTTLMRAAIAGDSLAYRRFLTLVTPYLRAAARNRCRAFRTPESDAEDIVQEVLLTIHLKRHTWDPSRSIGPWISAITRNKLIDSFRRRHRHVLVPLDDVMADLQADDREQPLAGRDIDRMLLKLKETERQIVQSISLRGNTVEETAARLNMSTGSVRVALHRALKRLAALYRSDVT